MQINPSSGSDGIIPEITFILQLKNTTVDYPTADKIRNCNRWYDKATSIILRADNFIEWDDDNQSNLPIATAALVSGQADYGISSATFLRITKVYCKDSNGNYNQLYPVNIHDPEARRMNEERNSNSSRPRIYDKIANSLIIDPAPNFASSDGLKIYYQRVVDYFTTSDTTQEPGFAQIFHRYLSLGGAYDYAFIHGMSELAVRLKAELKEMEADMTLFYAQKAGEENKRLRLRKEDYGGFRGFNNRHTDHIHNL